jgi:hypothetical protein
MAATHIAAATIIAADRTDTIMVITATLAAIRTTMAAGVVTTADTAIIIADAVLRTIIHVPAIAARNATAKAIRKTKTTRNKPNY